MSTELDTVGERYRNFSFGLGGKGVKELLIFLEYFLSTLFIVLTFEAWIC